MGVEIEVSKMSAVTKSYDTHTAPILYLEKDKEARSTSPKFNAMIVWEQMHEGKGHWMG